MNEIQTDTKNLCSDIHKLRILLIILTLSQVGYILTIFMNSVLWIKLNSDYKVNWIIGVFNFLVVGLFLWYNWKRLPVEKKKKSENTWMILFLGIIGMWLWIPNKNEITKFSLK